MKLETVLAQALGKKNVYSSCSMQEMYGYDSSPFFSKPDIIVFPSTTDEVSQVLKISTNFGVPVLARGAGTCISGGAVPTKAGIVLVMTRMNAILDIDPVSRTALVEPGVVNLDLQKALAPHNLIFPPDPASQKVSTIGGNVAECAGGIQGAKYGVTKNYVMGLELVLSNGTVTTTGLLSEAETLGPDTTGIFNGSEGTLAVITKILVSCLPRTESTRTALASFASINDAAQTVSAIIKNGIIPTALEIMDQAMLRAVDDFTGIGFPKDAQAVLLMEVDGYEIDLDHQLGLLVEICTHHRARDVKQAASAAERENLWKARRSGNGALGRIRPAYMVHDVTVPRNRVATLLTRIQKIGKTYDIIIAQMAHAGDGNAHPHLLYYPDEKNIQQKIHAVTLEIFKTALELGGTITGEHGIGLEKKAFMGMQFSKTDLDFMKKIQMAMDPSDLLNPGKIFPTRQEVDKSNFIGPPGKAGDSSSQDTAENSKDIDDHILEFIPDNLTLKVHGDTPLWEVQKTAASINTFLPLCTHTQGHLTMNTLVGKGAWGNEAFALGSLKEYIYGLEFVPMAGELISTGGHAAKNVAGYDLTRLLWKAKGKLGTIKAITLKLLPRPEKQRLIVQNFPSLLACIEYAKAALKANICLCTLKTNARAGSGKNNWQMITGLMGSAAVVDLHTNILLTLQKNTNTNFEIVDQDSLGDVWKNQEENTRSYPLPLLHGAGIRAPMFSFLAKNAAIFKAIENAYIKIDMGFPDLVIQTAEPSSSITDKIMTLEKISHFSPGFYLERPGKRQKMSLIYDELAHCMTEPFCLQKQALKTDPGKKKETAPCPA